MPVGTPLLHPIIVGGDFDKYVAKLVLALKRIVQDLSLSDLGAQTGSNFTWTNAAGTYCSRIYYFLSNQFWPHRPVTSHSGFFQSL